MQDVARILGKDIARPLMPTNQEEALTRQIMLRRKRRIALLPSALEVRRLLPPPAARLQDRRRRDLLFHDVALAELVFRGCWGEEG